MSFSLSMAVNRKLFSLPFSKVILGHSLVLSTTRKLPCVRITVKIQKLIVSDEKQPTHPSPTQTQLFASRGKLTLD